MESEYIRDYTTQKILGVIRYSSNGKQTASDYVSGKVLGQYDETTNKTYEYPSMRIIANGNVLSRLIYEYHNN